MQIIAELGREEKNNDNDDMNIKRGPDHSNDTFGMDDNDWNVYKDIQKNNFSEDEEDDQQALNELEERLTELDPEFNLILYQVGSQGHRPA
jgi:actin-related protein 5